MFEWLFGKNRGPSEPEAAPQPGEVPVRSEGSLAFCEWRLAHQRSLTAKMAWKLDEAVTGAEAAEFGVKREALAVRIPYWENQVELATEAGR